MKNPNANFAPFAARMQAEGLPEIVTRTFEHYYNQLADGQTGLIPETEIRPTAELPGTAELSEEMVAAGRDIESVTLARAVEMLTERRVFLHGNRTVILQ